MQTYKEALSVIPSDPPCKDDNAQNQPLKKISILLKEKIIFIIIIQHFYL